jgi:hypothetical protein
MPVGPIRVIARGPLFRGVDEHVVDAYLDEAQQTIAQTGYADLRVAMDRAFVTQTPYYARMVQIETQLNDLVIRDGGVVYGPWLEGVGSRNYPVTRFKGYRHWRRVRSALRRKAPEIARQILPRYLNRLS